jgi:hypothetical protein
MGKRRTDTKVLLIPLSVDAPLCVWFHVFEEVTAQPLEQLSHFMAVTFAYPISMASVRELRQWSNIPIIVLSARTRTESVLK